MKKHYALRTLTQIPVGIWVLGFVSMLMDISSEIIHSLLPVFMVTALGASMATIGLIEGIAEATAMIVRVFSGVLSDYLGKRKNIVLLGYSLSALTKPLFALSSSVGLVFAARFMDRIGKGIRGAPRDALVADLAPAHLRGASFGLRQSLDTVGALLGPLLAFGLMLLFANNFRAVFAFSIIPALIAVLLIVLGVEDAQSPSPSERESANPVGLHYIKQLPEAYWWVCIVGGVIALARFSEAFLILRALQGEMTFALVPVVLVVMNLVYTLSAYPVGWLADRTRHVNLLTLGLMALISADLILALGNQWYFVLIGAGFWGLHMGLTQGLLAAMIAETSPPHLRGTAFGVFNLLSGVALLLASLIAGILWDTLGASYTFCVGAAFSFIALSGLVYVKYKFV
ncbi:MFS transporter [Legionella quateirensis]|uniref:Major facilitator superfamily transporter n=1 Tax=Legionella quateirensis TaxID=45072 RepID=A0A378KUH5_9GAMM|nr:MFS transporter [Legionella quateirensis]KTD43363.1 major facilitator superfamily transporter [Legionella quateirensis]STY18245.1 major facilitator superfamily transporter [Legionella quateirensis]